VSRLYEFPVDYTAPEVRTTLGILEATIYRTSEIVQIVEDVGLPAGRLPWGQPPAFLWRSIFKLAAGQSAVDGLLDAVVNNYPALRVRLSELRSDRPQVALDNIVATAGGAPVSWKNFSEDGQAEAIIVAGQPTFVDVAFLAIGFARARSVCRLVTRFPGDGSGTGFRVGPRHLLTNHHVLFNHNDNDRKVTSAQAWFNYEADEHGELRAVTPLTCNPDSIVGEKADDWALIETNKTIPDQFPVLPIAAPEVPKVDDRVYIIQHPQGQPKKIAFQHNLVRWVDDDKIQYWTDTDLGSSGSPVFDERWAVVALHHFCVPAPESDRTSMRNQGRRIDRIVQRMKELGVYPG
jgi:V8-like Glu-specific endopeptidase